MQQQQQTQLQASSGGLRLQQKGSSGGKDLIIRMLAEVFQVNQNEESGQARWEQVSSSLVPVSLYSRTTSKWLNYLIAASCASNNTSAMSPDSRDFLLLLQQFHHQNRQQANSRNSRNELELNALVFQVVAHDFINGQCKKVLNVKLAQPGTRLGQASDYFVYWKEQQSCLQTPLASNLRQHANTSKYQRRQQQQFYPQLTLEPRTWGLNFASINDAKLFYDICSLNLVDLDFNSDYLKLLANSDRNSLVCQAPQRTFPKTLPPLPSPHTQQQHHNRHFLTNKQQYLNSNRQHFCQSQNQSTESALRRQLSASKCPSCKQLMQQQQLNLQPNEEHMLSNNDFYPSMCPVHSFNQSQNHVSKQNSMSMRTRSRSSSRQQSATSNKENTSLLKRVRSFSTPASPEHDTPINQQCPIHQQQDLKCDQVGAHHPRCLTLIKKQKDLVSKQSTLESFDKPKKPMRGVLRDMSGGTLSSSVGIQSVIPPPTSTYPKKMEADRSDVNRMMDECAFKKESKNIHHSNPINQWSPDNQQLPGFYGVEKDSFQQQHDQQASSLFSSSKAAQRRSTAIDLSNTSQIYSHRDASLARAQYANSKNMKEFLSLDAGGIQSTPTRAKTALNERFDNNQDSSPSNFTKHQSQKLAPTNQKSFQVASKRKPLPTILNRQLNDENALPGDKCIASATISLDSNIVCNASTTTEDLPMDSSTRKRMFKLISEEAISEKTEPKSISNIENGEDSKFTRDVQDKNDKMDRQKRAVSLGPDVEKHKRGRDARSDVGRRRSLERSMCIDSESVLPFRKQTCCLSRLPTLSSPNVIGLAKSSPSYSNDRDLLNQHPSSNNPAGPKRFRTKSTGEGGTCCSSFPDSFLKPDSSMGSPQYLKYCRNPHHEEYHFRCSTCNPKRTLSFKSAPDVRQLNDNQLNITGSQSSNRGHTCLNTLSNRPSAMEYSNNYGQLPYEYFPDTKSVKSSAKVKQKVAGISTYAIPLCTGDEHRRGYSRQCHSCPNSLSRKRRGQTIHKDGILQQQNSYIDSPDRFNEFCSSSYSHRDHIENFVRPSSVCNGSIVSRSSQIECYPCSSLPLPSYDSDDMNVIHHHCYNQHQRVCMACNKKHNIFQINDSSLNENRSSYNNKQEDEAEEVCQHSISHYRALSNQSTKSPLRYGLYESDCEEERLPFDDSMLEMRPKSSHMKPIICCGRIAYEAIERSNSAYFCPQAIKPVRGYDQTMARASLKTRQRAKSQPPDVDNSDDTFHLTKSMENVQKLIKEVQNELNAIKRRPLSVLNSSRVAPSTSVNNKGSDPVVKTNEIEGIVARQTSRSKPIEPNNEALTEEQGSTGSHLHQLEDGSATVCGSKSRPNISSSSATRRAGQFKCVGAIRKAGFLSVKKWILKRRQSIELARKQGWKRYWVCLRGTALLFYSVIERKDVNNSDHSDAKIQDLSNWIQHNCNRQMKANLFANFKLDNANDPNENLQDETLITQCYIEKEPRHLIIIDGAIAQPIPEHPKRDYVFCLSTTFGDAYLFQASCQQESDNWILAIHNACAASIARDLTRDEAIKLFEIKTRHLELEAEKKIFLRQRLESRLTSMSSMSHISSLISQPTLDSVKIERLNEESENKGDKKNTMRALLQRLNQQLLALDTYIEQVQCEIYQIRCYLSSCGSQLLFYQNSNQSNQTSGLNTSTNLIELPHPKSLLIHVSKPTKFLLIKTGVFTVSSFHAYIHARQGSADDILQKIHQASLQTDGQSPIELLVKSNSISETLLSWRNVELQNDTEELINISNLKSISIKVATNLFNKLRRTNNQDADRLPTSESDDRYSFHSDGDQIVINIKVHSNSNCMSIIKQVLKVIDSESNDLDFLEYYLKLVMQEGESDDINNQKNLSQYVAKRQDTLKDWHNVDYLELLEKIVFKVELTRNRTNEEAVPFGISIGAQLFVNKLENLLNVFCSYIEWGSAADKAGLKDDDELLMINGVPVLDLDMMFIECIIQDESKLRLVVRASRADYPTDCQILEAKSWKPSDAEGDGNQKDLMQQQNDLNFKSMPPFTAEGSQIISDEYISTLVCPPPPTQSSAFLRTDSSLIRQKSDMSEKQRQRVYSCRTEPLIDDSTKISNGVSPCKDDLTKIKARSQQDLDTLHLADNNETIPTEKNQQQSKEISNLKCSSDVSTVLLKKTEQLSQLMNRNYVEPWNGLEKYDAATNAENADLIVETKSKSNLSERLKKSILELLETEYAYIKHIETIKEHYMNPLREISFLNITDLKNLSNIITNLLEFQRDFFHKLTKNINDTEVSASAMRDDSEDMNKIVQQLESFERIEDLRSVLKSLTRTFIDEAERFKIYSSYCTTYSKLQKLLHPKRGQFRSLSSVISIPTALDTFQATSAMNSLNLGSGILLNHHNHNREFLKPLGSFMGQNTQNETSVQLKQLNEFLNNLDSSSSSVSLSLPKSSSSEKTLTNSYSISQTKKTTTASQGSLVHQKCAHQQNFESYLIKPIQRIVIYPMLLNSITLSMQVHANNDEDDLMQSLHEALKQMEQTTSFVNDTQRIYDEYGLIFEIIERQYFEGQQQVDLTRINSPSGSVGPHQPTISLDIDQLLYFGSVNWLNINEFTSKLKKGANLSQKLFVFSSCVVFICTEHVKSTKKKMSTNQSTITQPTNNNNTINVTSNLTSKTLQKSISDVTSEIIRYQSLIPVSEVQVRSVPSTQNADNKSEAIGFKWELFRCSSVNSNSNLLTKNVNKRTSAGGKVYLLDSESNDIRNAFLRKIRFIIRESVRNMSLPLARSPSNKSLTPKKLSSPSSGTNTNSSCSQSTSLSPVCKNKKLGKSAVNTNDDCTFKKDNNNFNNIIKVTN